MSSRRIDVVLRSTVPFGNLGTKAVEVRRKMSFDWEPGEAGEEPSKFQHAVSDPKEFKKILALTIMRGIEAEMPRMVDEFIDALEENG